MPSKIPEFTLSGILPPFVARPTDPGGRAPYATDTMDFCTRFGTSAHRVAVLQGFLAHRAALNALGFMNGFQWCDGSFVEDKDPADIDVVIFFHRPAQARDRWQLDQIRQQNNELFHPALTKTNYQCDAYFVDLTLTPEAIVAQTHYWFGLFSHRRLTAEWKGLVQVPLCSPNEDAAAATVLAARQQAQARP